MAPTKKAAAKKAGKTPRAGARARAPPASVDDRLAAVDHPKRDLIDALRKIVRGASPSIRERWKWNAPSFYVDADGALDPEEVPMDRNVCNVNLHREEEAMLVFVFFHGLPDDLPAWLDGSWKDRRTASFRTAADVRARQKELQTLVREMARRAERTTPA